MLWDHSLFEIFHKGSFVMWPLLLCSILGAAIICERSLFFFRIRLSYENFRRELRALLEKRKIHAALVLCRKSANPIPRIVEKYLKNLEWDDVRDDVIKREGSLALEKLERRFRGLAAITHIAPLLGLLGTVTGLVSAFHQIELLGGAVQPSDLAGGIWEALVTTVFGLTVAIPCMAAHHALSSQADKIARQMQFIVLELDEFFGKHSSHKFEADEADALESDMKAIH